MCYAMERMEENKKRHKLRFAKLAPDGGNLWFYNILENEMINYMKIKCEISLFLILCVFFLLSCSNRILSYTNNKKDNLFETNLDIDTGNPDIDSILHNISIEENIILKYELIDLNYDTYNDLVIYRPGCGTGHLIIIDVYYYYPQTRKFVYDNQLSEITNPSFYLSDSLITGFYIGHGGGNCISLRWNENSWKTSETITIEPTEMDYLKWKVIIKNHQTMIVKDTIMEIFVVPDTTLLRNRY